MGGLGELSFGRPDDRNFTFASADRRDVVLWTRGVMAAMKLYVTVGLPRSGKSTWARECGHPVVCPDEIRYALHGSAFYGPLEPLVWVIAKTMVVSLFRSGHNEVILDATSNTRKRRDEWKNIRPWNDDRTVQTTFVVFSASSEVCMKRAENDGVLKELKPVIARMFSAHEALGEDEDHFFPEEG